jgi:hypothetical protein
MNFFNLDCHISVISDLKDIFEKLGHSVTSWSISGHNWVLNKTTDNVDIVNSSSWHRIDEELCNKFFERYKDELSKYDAFICTYPPSFSMLYEKFNKPILLHIPIRYEVPFQSNKLKWENFNDYLRNKIDGKLIIPVANSVYDKKYFEFFVNKDCSYIPSLCEYTNTKWSPEIDKFLFYSQLNINLDSNIIVSKKSLGRYQWSDLTKYKGIIMIPYNCSVMSIFEYYTSNIPLFCPSINFMKELYTKFGHSVLSQLSWNQVYSMKSGSIIDCNRENDPNDYKNIEVMFKWVEHCDFYSSDWMPYITYFDSFEDLNLKLSSVNLNEISKKMESFNISRKEKIYRMWEEKINSIL